MKLNKLFLISYLLISTNLFAFSSDIENLIVQMHKEFDRNFEAMEKACCPFSVVKKGNQLTGINEDNIKEDENNIIINIKVEVEDPKKDIKLSVKDNILNVEINGKESLQLSIQNNILKFSSKQEIKEEKTEKERKSFQHIVSTTSKNLFLPASVNVDKVQPLYAEGILTIKLPKQENKKVEPKKIEVEVK